MQTMEANINRLLTETYISLCPVVINYLGSTKKLSSSLLHDSA